MVKKHALYSSFGTLAVDSSQTWRIALRDTKAYRHLGNSVSQPRRQSLHLLHAGRACGMSAPVEVAQCRCGPGITCIRTSRFSAGGLLSVADAIGRWVGQDTPQNREQSSQVARRTTLRLEAMSCARRGVAEGRVMASGCDALEGRKASIAADNLIWRDKRSPPDACSCISRAPLSSQSLSALRHTCTH